MPPEGEAKSKPPGDEVKKPLIPARYIQAFLLFVGMACTYYLRVLLSIAIIPMTDADATDIDEPVYEWEEKRKAYILSSFFWGYVLTQVLGGYLTHNYGAKFPVFIALLGCSVLCLFLPLSAELGDWPAVIALRVVQGLFQGFTFPAAHGFIAHWAPGKERGAFVSFVYSGLHVGTVLALYTGGFIATTPLGWRGSFYVAGSFGCVWSLVWLIFASSDPVKSTSITEVEKIYILSRTTIDQGKPPKFPIGKVHKSGAYYALLFPFVLNNFGFWVFLTEMPTYFHAILLMEMNRNGIYFSIAYIVFIIKCWMLIWVERMIKKHKLLSLNQTRKLFNTIGQLIPAICLIIIGLLRASNWAILLVIIGVSSNAATYFGIYANHIDLAPNFADEIMGIMNTFANIAALIAPLLVGAIVYDEHNPDLWSIVFYISAATFSISSIIFLLFGKTDVQEWNHHATEVERARK